MSWVDEMLSGIPVNAVLRERMLLVSEKRVALQEEMAALRAESEALRSENANLKKEIEAIKEQLTERQVQRLEEIQEKILSLIASQNGIPDQVVARSLNIGEQLATFHLQELESVHLARRTLRVGARLTPWHVTQEGRRYLVTYGILR